MTNYNNLRQLLTKRRLVLASGSPRRVRLLTEAGIPFRQIVADIDEREDLHPDPYHLAVILAEMKAEAVSGQVNGDEIILGCDTIVVLNGSILGKPESPEHAFAILSRLVGQRHTVCSAVALRAAGGYVSSGYELTNVFFKNVASEKLKQYIASGEPLDKAGAYGIQKRGGFLVDRYEGNLDNVIGLPMTLLDRLAGEIELA
ncbi:MAG: septum formation protein Maf [candidate division Zixibacteria bacterium]|nr:septum formation protein Maf [candidate division Zixibacteria bacterium]